MADVIILPNQKKSVHKLVNKINKEDRFETRLSYRSLISNLHINKPELTQPDDEKLLNRLDICNRIFNDVRTPREGVLDIIALKTISSFARIQTVAIDKKSTTTDAFKLIRKCAKIIKTNLSNYENTFAEFYTDFSHCHKTAGAMNFMSGRLPTFWFEKRNLEKSLLSQRSRRAKEIVDNSQHTQIQEIKNILSSGEQTSQEIIRIKQYLEQAFENNNNQPVNFFMFTIHPTLFSRSVENIFHVSFLVKEGKVELLLDKNQLPALRPLMKSDTQNDKNTAMNSSASDKIHSLTQLTLSLDIEQWETLVETNMSAGILPDVYRYTARKSTISKNLKSSNLSLCNNNSTSPQTTTFHYSTYHNDNNNSKQTPIHDTLEHRIKSEKEVQQQQSAPFTILPENEIEQMVISEINEQTNEEIINTIIEEIQNQIVQSSSTTSIVSFSNQIGENTSTDNQDVHDTMGSIMNQINENENCKFVSSIIVDNIDHDVHKNIEEITPMESDQPHINNSSCQNDDDIVEIKESSTNDKCHTCTCQCHNSNTSQNNDFSLFELALKQARLEQQQEKSLNNNRLIQTLKRQHEELLNIYQQNKNLKQFHSAKIDREQQTTKFYQHDSQVQTDAPSTNNSKLIPEKQQKSLGISTANSNTPNNNGSLLATRNSSINHTTHNSISTSSLISSQIAPRSSNTIAATTTTTAAAAAAKTSTSTTKSTISTNLQSIISQTLVAIPPPLVSNNISHDVVDLTEEDEDDTTNRAPAQRITATRQSMSFIQPSILSPSPSSSSSSSSSSPSPTVSTITATATATRIRSTTTTTTAATTPTTNTAPNRNIRPNTSLPNGQTFSLRPLPEHNPCDPTIARPQLNITQENTTVRLTWNLLSTPMESIQNYEIYAYKQNATLTASDWKKIGSVKSMRLPMAVTLKEFQSNSHYAFAVRAVSIDNRIGPFCEPKTIFTGNTPVQPLHTSQLLNVYI